MTTADTQVTASTAAPVTFGALIDTVLTRLGDFQQQVWTAEEAGLHLVNGQQQIAQRIVFWDWLYLENLPRGFSYTQAWEARDGWVSFDLGGANYTIDDEQKLLSDGRDRVGPANYTCPIEATDGWLASCGARTTIPATAEVPKTVTRITRVSWDKRGVDAMTPALMNRVDSRYQITRGEVYGFMWQVDGIRTLRKIRVPSAQAATFAIDGSWGLVREPVDISTDRPVERGHPGFDAGGFGPGFFTNPEKGTLWGTPRRLPGEHPIGPGRFGVPRRPFRDGTNVRVEHARQGAPLVARGDVCELPLRMTKYLVDYAQARLLERVGPGQDVKLAAHFETRWQRGLARIDRRLDRIDRVRVSILGGDGNSLTTRPPRPSRPWPYGTELR